MNSKSRSGLMIIAGGYLVYLGFKLMRDVINKDTGNSMVFMICAIFFMVVGALIAIYYVKNMLRLNAEESEAEEETKAEEKTEEIGTDDGTEGIEAVAEEQANRIVSDDEELPEQAAEEETE